MTWKDKAAAALFVVAALGSLATIAYIVAQSREEPGRAAVAAGDAALVRGIVLDFGRAVQRDDPESACVLLTGDAFEAFDCRFGRTDVPEGVALPEDARLRVGGVVVQGDQALVELRGGGEALPVRLRRDNRRWRIIRVGLPQPT